MSLESDAVDDCSETSERELGWVLDPLLDMVSAAVESGIETELSVVVLGRLVVSGTPESVDEDIGEAVESVVNGSVDSEDESLLLGSEAVDTVEVCSDEDAPELMDVAVSDASESVVDASVLAVGSVSVEDSALPDAIDDRAGAVDEPGLESA